MFRCCLQPCLRASTPATHPPPTIIPPCHFALPAGLPTPGTQLRVVDPETLHDVADGQQGLILARGPSVTAGYYRDEAATTKVCAWAWRQPCLSAALEQPQTRAVGTALLPSPSGSLHSSRCPLLQHCPAPQAFKAGDGWFDTGDLGWRAPAGVAGSAMAGCIVLTGGWAASMQVCKCLLCGLQARLASWLSIDLGPSHCQPWKAFKRKENRCAARGVCRPGQGHDCAEQRRECGAAAH